MKNRWLVLIVLGLHTYTYAQSILGGGCVGDTRNIDGKIAWKSPDSLNSLAAIVNYIDTICKTQSEKYRAAFRWVSCKIVYDENINVKSFEEVFANRKSDYRGYSLLLQEFCKRLKIKCETIDGYARHLPIGTKYHQSKAYCWNQVVLNDTVYHSDPLAASGMIKEVRCPMNHSYMDWYYLMDPDYSSFYRFTYDTKYQKDQIPKTLGQFCNAPEIPFTESKTNVMSFAPLDALVVTRKMEKTFFTLVLKKEPHIVDIEIWPAGMINYDQVLIPIDFVQDKNKTSFYWEFEDTGSFNMWIYTDSLRTLKYDIRVTEK